MKKSILVDVDNTIVNQLPRKMYIIKKKLKNETIDEATLKYDYDVLKLKDKEREYFFKELFGPDHQEYLTAYDGAVNAIRQLKNKYRIFYISGRPISQYEITANLLDRLGFPKPDGDNIRLYLWQPDEQSKILNNSEIVDEYSKWKFKCVEDLSSSHDIISAISDTPQDVLIFLRHSIPSILFHSHSDIKEMEDKIIESLTDKTAISLFTKTNNWQTILDLIATNDNNFEELAKLVTQHTTEYASFLDSLDSKARFLLGVGTFLSTSFFALFTYVLSIYSGLSENYASIEFGWYPQSGNIILTIYLYILILCAIGILTSLLVMVFSIRSFGSRHTRGEGIGRLIEISNWKNIIPSLIGKKLFVSKSPIEDADNVRKMRAGDRKLARFAFFHRMYGTIDPEIIKIQRMLDLRSLNYQKIVPEIYARRMIFFSLIIVPICMVLLLIASNL